MAIDASDFANLGHLASLGVGGAVAGLVLWWKRIDDKKCAARDRDHDKELVELNARMVQREQENAKELLAANVRLEALNLRVLEVVSSNTQALAILSERHFSAR